MSDPQGTASFPGIRQVRACSFTVAHGISPGVAMLEILPQESIDEETGTLTISYGGNSISLQDCKIDSASYERNDSGQIVRLNILDHRWKWKFGNVRGFYNLRRKDGTLVKDSEKKPQELVKLLAEAMKEKIDAGDLPDDARPLIEWDGDTIPAQALADLCDQFGCHVVPTKNKGIKVCKTGEGETLPTSGGDVAGMNATIDPPEKPGKLIILCGRTRYQADFILEAVGREPDGTWKPLDDLSYKPEDDWTACDIPHFNSISDQKLRDLARRYVFKAYRIKGLYGEKGKEEIGDEGSQVKRLDMILPLETVLCEEAEPDEDNEDAIGSTTKPAIVFGVWYNRERTGEFLNTAEKLKPITDDESEYAKKVQCDGFSIDTANGIVMFSQQVFKLAKDEEGEENEESGPLKPKPAELILRTAVGFRDEKTRAYSRYERERKLDGGGDTQPRYILKDDIVLKKRFVYQDSESYSVEKIEDNKDKVDEECDHYLDAAEKEYETDNPQSVDYVGLKTDIDLDGAIQSITYSVGPGGTTTRAQRNNDVTQYAPSYKEKRFNEGLKAVVKDSKRSASSRANDYIFNPVT